MKYTLKIYWDLAGRLFVNEKYQKLVAFIPARLSYQKIYLFFEENISLNSIAF